MTGKGILATLILIIALAGCGGRAATTPTQAASPTAATTASSDASQAPTGATGPSGDVCSLMTKDEAGQLLGAAVTETKTQGSGSHGTCWYYTAGEAQNIVVSVYWSGAKEAGTGFRNLAGSVLVPVPNVGDEAFFTGLSLFVRKGDAGFTILTDSTNSLPGKGDTNELKAEAAKMVSRLS